MQQRPHLPENVVSVTTLQGGSHGVRIDVTGFHCVGRVSHQLSQTKETRLSVVLEEVGGHCEPRLRPNRPNPIHHMPRHMHFAPAGLEMWGHADDVRFVRDATLSFDVSKLSEAMATVFPQDALDAPRLRFADDRLWTLVRLLSDALGDTDPSTELYCDGLTIAIAARLLASPSAAGGDDSTALAPWRLRRVLDYLEARLPQRVELGELAQVAGLSPSHFSRAFKASTGMAPYQWQLDARIRRAQVQLLNTDASLEDVAEAQGFADAVHFGRRFRKLIGTAPAAWRRELKS